MCCHMKTEHHSKTKEKINSSAARGRLTRSECIGSEKTALHATVRSSYHLETNCNYAVLTINKVNSSNAVGCVDVDVVNGAVEGLG